MPAGGTLSLENEEEAHPVPGTWADGVILAWKVGRTHQLGPGGDATLGLGSWEGDLLGSGGGLILGLMKKTIGGPWSP